MEQSYEFEDEDVDEDQDQDEELNKIEVIFYNFWLIHQIIATSNHIENVSWKFWLF